MTKRIGEGTMVFKLLVEKNVPIWALFDDNSNIRWLAWYREDLIKIRKNNKWKSSCKIKKIKLSWRSV